MINKNKHKFFLDEENIKKNIEVQNFEQKEYSINFLKKQIVGDYDSTDDFLSRCETTFDHESK